MSGRQAITTKFLGPTNTRGARVRAKADAGQLIASWDYDLNTEDNHTAAALALATELAWDGPWHSGWVGHEAVFVNSNRADFTVRSSKPFVISKESK